MRRNLMPLLVAACCASPVLADEARVASPLGLTTGKVAEFEVYFDRTSANMAGAAFFGLVGAAIQEGANGSGDRTRTKDVAAKLQDASCGAPLAQAVRDALAADGTYAVQAPADKVPTVKLEVRECGLRLVDSTAQQLASYVDLRVEYVAPGRKWTEDIQITGRERRPYDAFLTEEGLAQRELSAALKRAGVRVANKVIYQK